jgi:hypothetical protein
MSSAPKSWQTLPPVTYNDYVVCRISARVLSRAGQEEPVFATSLTAAGLDTDRGWGVSGPLLRVPLLGPSQLQEWAITLLQ